jgi:hypothetical protein
MYGFGVVLQITKHLGGNLMAQEKLSFEQFLEAVDNIYQRDFAQHLHDYMLASGCKATFEAKKTGLLGSYKHTKTKKSVINVLLKKHGLLVRIYGGNANEYLDFLNTLPEEMVRSIDSAGECKRLVHGTCSPKCSGYDVTIGGKRFQKCRYSGFEFLVTEVSGPYIKSFVEHEIKERAALLTTA